ncbi:MAG TPA: hypothetical protein VNM39_03320 [Verrucomicrobiae bacterium]|nr:hypothetical protein [Verrucomicrobiae bacterium]
MPKKIIVTVYEHITECFDCEIEVPDGLEGDALDDWLASTVEDIRVNGDHERQFVSVDDTDWEEKTQLKLISSV